MSNPYKSPTTSSLRNDRVEIVSPRRLDWLIWMFTLLPAVSVYLSWIVAWIVLGHPPRPSLDDPTQIGPAVSAFYFLSGLFLISIPLLAIAGPVVQLSNSGRKLFVRAIYSFVSLLITTATIVLFRWDPLHVMYWYMD